VDRLATGAEGYRVKLQAWDFRPGSDFVQQMNQAVQEAERTIGPSTQRGGGVTTSSEGLDRALSCAERPRHNGLNTMWQVAT
jgi:hypothetical protein